MLIMLPSDVQRGFSASGSTTFAEFTDTVCTMLSCPDARLSLEFKLSTDPKTAKWYSLDSPDDWAHAISRVRHKRAQQKTRSRRSVNVEIRLSPGAVSQFIQSMTVFILIRYTSMDTDKQ